MEYGTLASWASGVDPPQRLDQIFILGARFHTQTKAKEATTLQTKSLTGLFSLFCYQKGNQKLLGKDTMGLWLVQHWWVYVCQVGNCGDCCVLCVHYILCACAKQGNAWPVPFCMTSYGKGRYLATVSSQGSWGGLTWSASRRGVSGAFGGGN